MSALVNELILENKGTFENKRVNNIYEYGVYGKTMRHKLYASDKKERYFHLYHSISKESAERIEIENRINQMTQYLKKYQNKVKEFNKLMRKSMIRNCVMQVLILSLKSALRFEERMR